MPQEKLEYYALIGFSDLGKISKYTNLLEDFGYKVQAELLFVELLKKATLGDHSLYLMDFYLGNEKRDGPSTASQVYELVKNKVISKKAKFFALSNGDDDLFEASYYGFIVMNPIDLFSNIETLLD